MRKQLTDNEKEIVGKECCNCSSIEDLEYHHIVPLSLGGQDKLSNICCLCYKCHSLIHFGTLSSIVAVQITCVSPHLMEQDPSACLFTLISIATFLSSSGILSDGLIIVLILSLL